MNHNTHRNRLLAFLLFNFAFSIAQATPVFFSMQQLTGNAATSRFTLIADSGANPYTDGTNMYGGGVVQPTPVNGTNIINLAPIGWTLVCPGWSHTLHFVVPPDTNLWNVVNLFTNALTPMYPPQYIFSWTADVLDSNALSQVQQMLASSTNFASASVTNLTPAQLQTISMAATNQPYVSAFLAANGINDDGRKNDLNIAVQQWARFGVQPPIECFIPEVRWCGSNHVALVGNTWTTQGTETYTEWAQQMLLANVNKLLCTLPATLTNFTAAVTVRCAVSDYDTGPYSALGMPGRPIMASLYSSVDNSCVALHAFVPGQIGSLIYTSAGNTIYNAGIFNFTMTNGVNFCTSGNYSDTFGTHPLWKTTYCFSYSNGVVSVYRNGNQGLFILNAGYQSNSLVEFTNSSPVDTFTVGFPPAMSVIRTNFQGEIGCVQIFIGSSTNVAQAAFAFASCLEDTDTAVLFNGSSRISYLGQAFTSGTLAGGIPLTNSVPILFQQQHKNWYVLDDAYPGSCLTNYLKPVSVVNPVTTALMMRYPYVPPLTYLPTAKFKVRVIKTNAGDNDLQGLGITPPGVVALLSAFYLPYWTNGITIDYMESGWRNNDTLAKIQNMTTGNLWIETNCPWIHKFLNEQPSLTFEYLSQVALDTTHVGLTNSIMGYRASVALAHLLDDGSPYPRFVGGTNLVVAGNPFLWTNYYPYTVKLTISGGNVGGITRNGVTVTTTNAVAASFVLTAYPGDALAITNVAAPNVYLDSTQP